MIRVDEFVNVAKAWLGVPYLHQGRSRYGVDCIGYPIVLLRDLKLLPDNFRDYTRYGRQPDGQMEPIVESYCARFSRPVPGCLVLIMWPKMKHASHAAIYTGRTLIHSHQRAGGVVEHGFRGSWLKNLHSTWLLPGVIYE